MQCIVILQDSMPPMLSMDILPGTQPTQYYKKLKAWPLNITAQQNTVGHKQKVLMRPIFTWRSERSSTVSQLNQGWFSQELGPDIKSTYQGLKRTAQPKKMWWPYLCIWYWVTLVTHLMQGNANVNSVEPPLAPRKQRIKTTSQTQLMITT